jgi:hypothetical protein
MAYLEILYGKWHIILTNPKMHSLNKCMTRHLATLKFNRYNRFVPEMPRSTCTFHHVPAGPPINGILARRSRTIRNLPSPKPAQARSWWPHAQRSALWQWRRTLSLSLGNEEKAILNHWDGFSCFNFVLHMVQCRCRNTFLRVTCKSKRFLLHELHIGKLPLDLFSVHVTLM